MPRKRREMKGNRKPNPLQKSHGFIILKWFFSHHQQETILCLILEKISKNYKIRPQNNHPRTQITCRILNYSLFPTNPTHTLCLVRKRLDRKINKTRNFESLSNIFFSILFFLNEKKQKNTHTQNLTYTPIWFPINRTGKSTKHITLKFFQAPKTTRRKPQQLHYPQSLIPLHNPSSSPVWFPRNHGGKSTKHTTPNLFQTPSTSIPTPWSFT